jgi:diacylglycerol kinase family enzyme
VAGLGLEAELAHRFRASRVRGLLGYLSHGLAVVRQLPAEHVRITAEGRETGFLASTLAVANGDQYGNDAFIAPSARCDDGQLELERPASTELSPRPATGASIFRGTLNRDRRVLRQRARAFTVRRANAGLIRTRR